MFVSGPTGHRALPLRSLRWRTEGLVRGLPAVPSPASFMCPRAQLRSDRSPVLLSPPASQFLSLALQAFLSQPPGSGAEETLQGQCRQRQ